MFEDKNPSPLMRQYYEVKKQFPQALVLFQVGDFYELFYDDAIKAAAFLGITLTRRNTNSLADVPFCGVPVHAVDHYLIKLVRGGFRVVLCDQLTKPQPGKKIVERGVRQVLTPGTLTDLTMLNEKSASYIAAVIPMADRFGIACAELLTGQFFTTVIATQDTRLLEAELSRFLPDEIILPEGKAGQTLEGHIKKLGYATTLAQLNSGVIMEDEQFTSWLAQSVSESVYLFIANSEAMRSALALLYYYLKTTCQPVLSQTKQLFVYSSEEFLLLDAATQRNLELVRNAQDGSAANTLFSVLDKAVTPMGSRQIKKWLLRPLVKREAIEQRLDAVEALLKTNSTREELVGFMKVMGDFERVVGRIALGRAALTDYVGLMRTLELVPAVTASINSLLSTAHETGKQTVLSVIKNRLGDFTALFTHLQSALNDDSSHDWFIKAGYSAELDRLRFLLEQGAQSVLELERREQTATGINSLKIRYSKPHGYGIEVTKANLDLVPERYTRLQTLASRERFSTPELRDLEYELQRAQTTSDEVEQQLFTALTALVEKETPALKKAAQALAHLDALIGFAECAYHGNYTRPAFNQQGDSVITAGRHPVVESLRQHEFIPNDTMLTEAERLWIITGPNMGGKSTFLRQVALISIMAQAGSFVSAQRANLPLLDRIFTRIGAADNVAAGKSTFLVEMEETALICSQATERSLVILDEVGRGTSTYDGLALAQAILEYIYTTIQARCLFATHYHELTTLVQDHPGIATYYAASKETPDGIVLLHKIIKGVAQGSFGLEVARKAQLPQAVVQRATSILKTIQQRDTVLYPASKIQSSADTSALCNSCDHKSKLQLLLDAVDPDAMSPRQAWELLYKLKSTT